MSSETPIPSPAAPKVVLRFDTTDRALHGFLMTSFLGLTLTGVPLLFNHEAWAATLARFFGGFSAAGTIHRFFAVVMIATFVTHVTRIVKRLYADKDLGILWGPRSMVPQPRDVREFIQHIRFFFGFGKRPKFEHFTYWEKFDYWAVFWGMGIIGGSGLLLWFPERFAAILPGWLFNIALIVHGEEALLATCFIFTIHFFNGHLRPEKFPMDTVIFTGRIPIEEIRFERAGEFERMGGEAGLEPLVVRPAKERTVRIGRIAGTIAVVIGLTMVVLTIRALMAH
jgi:cytochrome b subunit of formate dehydrogenase